MTKEEWRPVVIPSLPHYGEVYSVSNGGVVRRTWRDEPLTVFGDKDGYQTVFLSYRKTKKRMTVHRLVMLAFSEIDKDPKRIHINHVNGIKSDNRIENLAWVTPRENLMHSYKVLGRKCGYGTPGRSLKLKPADIKEIRAWWKTGDVSMRSLSKRWGVSKTTMATICHGTSWRHVA